MRDELQEWYEAAYRGTRGDMVFDILKDWKADRVKFMEAIEDIRQVATGEKQVANDDTEGMAWITKRIAALNLPNP